MKSKPLLISSLIIFSILVQSQGTTINEFYILMFLCVFNTLVCVSKNIAHIFEFIQQICIKHLLYVCGVLCFGEHGSEWTCINGEDPLIK